MSDQQFEARLIEALSALESGQPIEAILRRYPEDAEALRAHLQTVQALSRLGMSPRSAARARSRAAFLAAAEDLRTRRARRWLPFLGLIRLSALEAMALLLVVIGLSTVIAVAMASRSSINPADQPSQTRTETPDASPTPTATDPADVETPERMSDPTRTPAPAATATSAPDRLPRSSPIAPTQTPVPPTAVIIPPTQDDDDNDNGDNDNGDDDGDDDGGSSGSGGGDGENDNDGGDDGDGGSSGPGSGDDD